MSLHYYKTHNLLHRAVFPSMAFSCLHRCNRHEKRKINNNMSIKMHCHMYIKWDWPAKRGGGVGGGGGGGGDRSTLALTDQ